MDVLLTRQHLVYNCNCIITTYPRAARDTRSNPMSKEKAVQSRHNNGNDNDNDNEDAFAFSQKAIRHITLNHSDILNPSLILTMRFDIFAFHALPIVRNRPLLILGVYILQNTLPFSRLFLPASTTTTHASTPSPSPSPRYGYRDYANSSPVSCASSVSSTTSTPTTQTTTTTTTVTTASTYTKGINGGPKARSKTIPSKSKDILRMKLDVIPQSSQTQTTQHTKSSSSTEEKKVSSTVNSTTTTTAATR